MHRFISLLPPHRSNRDAVPFTLVLRLFLEAHAVRRAMKWLFRFPKRPQLGGGTALLLNFPHLALGPARLAKPFSGKRRPILDDAACPSNLGHSVRNRSL